MDDNSWLTAFISNLLDPSLVYEHLTYGSALFSVVPFLMVVFVTFRILQEASEGLSGKAAFAEAVGDVSKGLLFVLGWASGGMAIFTLLWAFAEIFGRFGSAQLIHDEMLQLRNVLMSDDEARKSFWMEVVEHVGDFTSVFNGMIGFLLYQLISVAYAVISALINVLFAVGLALTYAWGFIALPTKSMKPPFNLTDGLAKTVLTFFIWVVLEHLLIGFTWILGQSGAEFLRVNYESFGAGVTAVSMWYFYASAMMSLVLMMKIISPFLALKLAQNQSMVGGLAMTPAVLGGLVANQVVKTMSQAQQGMTGHMAPSTEGSRTRDRMAQSVGDVARTPIGQLMPGSSGGAPGGGDPGGGNDLTSGEGPAVPGGSSSSGSVPGGSGAGGPAPTPDSGSTGQANPAGGDARGDLTSESPSSDNGSSGPTSGSQESGASSVDEPQDLTSAPPSDPTGPESGSNDPNEQGGRS